MIAAFKAGLSGGMAGSRDLGVAAILLIAVALMILPMPAMLVDVVIGLNFGIAILLVMTAIYLRSPLEFSSLPTVILIATIFRLSLSITTTRLILSTGEPGAIIRTFGEFVIAGSVVVGMVVFFIITIVQLIVIAKGSERVAEVGARFTLDAMPGKQMAIDADLRNGDIDQDEARRQRARLGQESQLFGAMDGAMKFVKGDSLAGIVIILVNLVGGIVVGTIQRGMAFGDAVQEYSLLTVGDALISQIPALLLSLAASVVVTRVASEAEGNVGRDIAAQLSNDHRALFMAGALLFAMAFLPGFPAVTIVSIAALFLGLAAVRYLAVRRLAHGEADEAGPPDAVEGEGEGAADLDGGAGDAEAPHEAGGSDDAHARIGIVLAPALALDASERHALRQRLERVRRAWCERNGIECPALGLREGDGDDASRCLVAIDDVPAATFELSRDVIFFRGDVRDLALADIPHDEAAAPLAGTQTLAVRIGADHAERAAEAGLDVVGWGEAMEIALEHVLQTRAGDFLGIQETRILLGGYEDRYAELLKEVLRTSSLQRIADIFRRLLEEGVALTNMRAVLEALAEWGERERDTVMLTEYVRLALKRQICHQHASRHGMAAARTIPCLLVAQGVEERIRSALRETNVGTYLVMDEASSDHIVAAMRREVARARGSGADVDIPFVLMTSMDVRRYLRSLMARNGIDVAVLSHQELDQAYHARPVGSLELDAPEAATMPQAA